MYIFLISPVRAINDIVFAKVKAYVSRLESEGHIVYWPYRDTAQNDPSGGYNICRANVSGMLGADEIHIWYDETSNGSKFDMGTLFVLVEILGHKKRIVIANEADAAALDKDNKKSFLKVLQHIVARQNAERQM